MLVTVEYFIDPAQAREFYARHAAHAQTSAAAMEPFAGDSLKTPRRPAGIIETFVVESWAEHLRQHERVTISDREVEARALAFHQGDGPPKVTHWIVPAIE